MPLSANEDNEATGVKKAELFVQGLWFSKQLRFKSASRSRPPFSLFFSFSFFLSGSSFSICPLLGAIEL